MRIIIEVEKEGTKIKVEKKQESWEISHKDYIEKKVKEEMEITKKVMDILRATEMEIEGESK